MVVVPIAELKARKGRDEAYAGSWQTAARQHGDRMEGKHAAGQRGEQTCSGAAWRQSGG